MSKSRVADIPDNLPVQDWARLAAFIDGEGCIAIYRNNIRTKETRWHSLRVHITNTDPRLMLWLKRFGVGTVKIKNLSGRRRRYDWSVSGRVAMEILIRCIPNFVMKGDQAVLAISFQEVHRNWGRAGIPAEYINAFEFCCNAIARIKIPPTMESVQ
jgi:hypothetical protein